MAISESVIARMMIGSTNETMTISIRVKPSSRTLCVRQMLRHGDGVARESRVPILTS